MTSSAYSHPGITLDQKVALRTAATRLTTDFGDMFGVETIERFLNSSYDQFASRATVFNFPKPWTDEGGARSRHRHHDGLR